MSHFWFKNLFARQKRGFLLIFLGIICFLTAFLIKGYSKFPNNSLSFSQTPKEVESFPEESQPARILIPRLNIDLPVFPAQVSHDQWPVSKEGASYFLNSGVPGQPGNTVIYGHNKNHLLGPIRWLVKDDQVKVVSKKGQDFVYQVIETKTVTPENVEILFSTEDSTLTLYTCAGFLDKKRFVVITKLQPKFK